MSRLTYLYFLFIQTVSMMYIRLDEGEILFSSETIRLSVYNKFSNEIEKIQTLDLQQLVSIDQNSPITILKLKQYNYNHSYQIGVLLQLPNMQYQVKKIWKINETMSNGSINCQSTNISYQIALDKGLNCLDFAFKSDNTVQILCFKDQIILVNLDQNQELNRIVLDTPINQLSNFQLFYYPEKQLSIIFTQTHLSNDFNLSIDQEDILIFIKDNSIYKLIFLNQLTESRNLQIIEIVLLRQYLIILSKFQIIQIDLNNEKKYLFQSMDTFNQIHIIDNQAWIQTIDRNYYFKFSEETQSFFSFLNYNIKTAGYGEKTVILNSQSYYYNQSKIQISEKTLDYDYFITLPNLNGLILIQNTSITFYQLNSNYHYIEMNNELKQQYLAEDFGLSILINNDSIIFRQQLEILFYQNEAKFGPFQIDQTILTYSPIESGPYGIVHVQQDSIGLFLKTFKLKFCFENKYNFIYFLNIVQVQSYWLVQQNYTLYFVICQEQQLIALQQLGVLEIILSELQFMIYQQNPIKVQLQTIDTTPMYFIKIKISNDSNIEHSIIIKEIQYNLSNAHKVCENNVINEKLLDQFHTHFQNDTVYIYQNSLLFNGNEFIYLDYKFENSTILQILTFSFNYMVIILKDEQGKVKLINYRMQDGKLIRLKEIPTFGYVFKKVFDIQRYSTQIILLLESLDQNQFLAIYQLDLPKIDCQIGFIEYNPKFKYLFHKDVYLQLNFQSKSYQIHKYYMETYVIEFESPKQFFTNHTIQFSIKNQLFDEIITTNVAVYDYSTKLVSLQDTFAIQHQAEMIIPVQKLFYGFISNITCTNCKINFPFMLEQKYRNDEIVEKDFSSKQITLSKNYIIGTLQKKNYILFNKKFEKISEINLDISYIIKSLIICDDCFIFIEFNMINLYIQVKQIVKDEFQTIFSQNIQLDINVKLIRYFQAHILIIYYAKSKNDSFSYDLYQFVLNEKNQIGLQMHQSQLLLKRLINPKLKELDQFILIFEKISQYECSLLLLNKITFTQSYYQLMFTDSNYQNINCHKLFQYNKFITLTCYVTHKNSKIFIGDICLNQPVIYINLGDANYYSHLLIVEKNQYILRIHYISDKIVIVSSQHYKGPQVNQILQTNLTWSTNINIYFLGNKNYSHPIQIEYTTILQLNPFINNTFIYISKQEMGFVSIQEWYSFSTQDDNVQLKANGLEQIEAIVTLIIIRDKPFKIQILFIFIFGIGVCTFIWYQKWLFQKKIHFELME